MILGAVTKMLRNTSQEHSALGNASTMSEKQWFEMVSNSEICMALPICYMSLG